MPQTQSEALELLLEVGRLLSSKLNIDELLKTVLALSARVVDAQSASLLLLDEKTQELYFDVALGLGEQASRLRLNIGQGIAGSVARDLKGIIINDTRADPRWSAQVDAQSGFVTRSILAVPLMIKGRLIGVVEALNKNNGAFDARDLKTFEAFASQASVAIDNARLFSSLKEEKLRLDTIFTEMADGAILTDGSGRILLINQAARKLTGAGDPENLADAFTGLNLTPDLPQILAGVASPDFVAVREQPKKLVLGGKINRLPLGWLCVFRDDTEKWQKENVKRTFLALISHKLKTPLAAITGFAEVLLSEFSDTPPSPIALKAAESIAVQGRKLAGLVEKLLCYTTLENPESTVQFVPCAVNDIIQEALKDLGARLAEARASIDYQPDGKITVICNKEQLRDAVKNLVENSIKFDTKPEKKIAITVEGSPDQIAIKVQDTGRGIPPEDQDKVFSQFHQVETFFTGQVEGCGLGLPFVKKVVEGHGGKVELSSQIDKGTTVVLRLPARPGTRL
ncbi:MAG: hypothetical protein A3J74_06650 [Elusimicrobia bacterium RIFCSPHIGHO2_02_FULL_57_9]|nr:MAG: hypothetical protein A3J74_06650 [Elusimicrobia bacterium RIFCSPHIGHO2_02_FULL_57_9]